MAKQQPSIPILTAPQGASLAEAVDFARQKLEEAGARRAPDPDRIPASPHELPSVERPKGKP